MASPSKFHLFNCDSVYKLDSIQDLLLTTTRNLGIDISVEQHYFTVSEITEYSHQKIPTLEMDAAILAVNANESRLSINENTEGGYTKVYRALLQATDGNVIVVIGGDDNYRNEEEEERAFVSRWARMKVRSQLKEEFLDGRRSFIFSWDRKHRAIHEQALKHYFDPKKKGQKFEYEPPGRLEPSLRDPTASVARDTEPAHQPRLQRSATLIEGRSKQEIIDRWDQPSSFQKDYTVTRQRSEDIRACQQPKLNVHLDPLTATAFSTSDYGRSSLENRSEQNRVQRDTTMKETRLVEDVAAYSELDNKPQQLSVRTDRVIEGERKVKDLVVLGCDVSPATMQVVKSVIDDLHRRIRLPEYPQVESYSLADIKSYLTRYTLRFCILVVDADASHKIQQPELEELLRTAAEVVVEKVIFTICNRCHAPTGVEEKFVQNVERMLKAKRKGLVVWLEDGKLNVEPDVMIQLMLGAPIAVKNRQRQISHSRESLRPTNVASGFSSDRRLVHETPKHMGGFPSQELRHNPTSYSGGMYHTVRPDAYSAVVNDYGEEGMDSSDFLMLKTRIRRGRISYATEDLLFRYPGWVIPEKIEEDLRWNYSTTANGVLSIYSNTKGELRATVQTDRAAICLII